MAESRSRLIGPLSNDERIAEVEVAVDEGRFAYKRMNTPSTIEVMRRVAFYSGESIHKVHKLMLSLSAVVQDAAVHGEAPYIPYLGSIRRYTKRELIDASIYVTEPQLKTTTEVLLLSAGSKLKKVLRLPPETVELINKEITEYIEQGFSIEEIEKLIRPIYDKLNKEHYPNTASYWKKKSG